MFVKGSYTIVMCFVRPMGLCAVGWVSRCCAGMWLGPGPCGQRLEVAKGNRVWRRGGT